MKGKAKRLLAFFLCMLMLLTTAAIPAFAQENSGSSSGSSSSDNTSMSDVSAILNALSYDEYMENVLSKYQDKVFGEGHVIEVDILGGVFTVGDTTTNLNEFYRDSTKCDEPSADGKNDGVFLGSEGTATWTFVVDEKFSGNYTIQIVYCQADDRVIDKSQASDDDKEGTSNAIERIFYLNGSFPFAEARTLVLNKVWEYDYTKTENGENSFKNEKENGKGNDIRPAVYKDPTWVKYTISDSNGYYVNPFEFYIKPGENTISLEGQREDLIIQSIKLIPYEEPISYKEYIAEMEALHGKVSENRPDSSVFQEAEEPLNVSAITMYPVYDRTSSITSGLTGKQSASAVKYNTAGKEQWQNVGEWMSYDIEVPESGYYTIAVRYKQSLLSGMYVSRKLYINDEVPFKEAANCRFPHSNSWQTCFLGDGKTEFEFYFEAGKTYNIKLEATLGEMGEQIKQVSDSLSNINNCYLEILKLTGTDPDANRSYGFTRVMPDVLKVMLYEAQNLESVYNYLVSVNKAQDGGTGEGEKTATIKQVYQLLEKMATNESEIPANLSTLKSQIGSLGTWINSAKTQPLQVDYYQLQSKEEKLPKADANFFQALWFEIKLFVASFAGDSYDEQNTTASDVDEVIEVWVVTGRDQAQIIRNLIENDFTPNKYVIYENGEAKEVKIGVNIKLIAGGTLLPSIIAGVGPEVSLMEGSSTIIDYALRNAIKPLNDYINNDIENYDPASGKDNILEVFPNAAFEPLTLYNFGYGDSYSWTDEDLYLWRQDTQNGVDTNGEGTDDDATYGYGWVNKDKDGKVESRGIELYAMPDSLSFSMMFYRKDVLTSLEIELPETWDDMLAILPILQYNNMEIGIQNDMYTFTYQNGYEAYSNNGMTINFGSPGVLNSFEQMCNYYTQYSLPYTYDFANRFRTGEMPIGISAYTSCNQLSVFASELSGLWTFVPLPGQVVKDADGNTVLNSDGTAKINRSAIAAVTGCVMIDNGSSAEQQKKDLCAWEFMRWYTGSEFQADYSNEIVSIMGIAARPATANRLALEDLPWTSEEKNNISKQFESLVAVPNHPGSYYLARYVNFAFLAAYNEGKDASDSLNEYVATINKELARRRQEFGMLTYDDYIKLNPDGMLK